MNDLPRQIHIKEEGPREGFQIEKGPIPTARKIELIDALSKTGLKQIQIVSFVSPKPAPNTAATGTTTRSPSRRSGSLRKTYDRSSRGAASLVISDDGTGGTPSSYERQAYPSTWRRRIAGEEAHRANA